MGAHLGIKAADTEGSCPGVPGTPKEQWPCAKETTPELSKLQITAKVTSPGRWLTLGNFAESKSNPLQRVLTEHQLCALHSSLYRVMKTLAPRGPGSPRFLIMGAPIPAETGTFSTGTYLGQHL